MVKEREEGKKCRTTTCTTKPELGALFRMALSGGTLRVFTRLRGC